MPLVPTDDVIKYLEKTPQNAKKLRNVEVMDVCAASLVGVPTGGQLFVLFYMRKINYYVFKKAEKYVAQQLNLSLTSEIILILPTDNDIFRLEI